MIMFLCNNVVWESISNAREPENPMLHGSVKPSLAQWRKRAIMKPRVQQTFSDLCRAQNEDEINKQSSNWRGFFLLSNNPIYDCWKSSENMWTFDLQWDSAHLHPKYFGPWLAASCPGGTGQHQLFLHPELVLWSVCFRMNPLTSQTGAKFKSTQECWWLAINSCQYSLHFTNVWSILRWVYSLKD